MSVLTAHVRVVQLSGMRESAGCNSISVTSQLAAWRDVGLDKPRNTICVNLGFDPWSYLYVTPKGGNSAIKLFCHRWWLGHLPSLFILFRSLPIKTENWWLGYFENIGLDEFSICPFSQKHVKVISADVLISTDFILSKFHLPQIIKET